MGVVGEHAVVLGAGMAGLLTARVLTESYRQVTVIERDQLAEHSAGRRGVPQGRHAHLLLARGRQALEGLFPGLIDELVADGAVPLRALEDFPVGIGGYAARRAPVGGFVSMTRPFLEGHVRARLTGDVRFIDATDVIGPVTSGDGRGGVRVTGVRVAPQAAGPERDRENQNGERVIGADLVVDALGRAGRSPAWLREMGYPEPPVDELHVDIGYASRLMRLPAGALGTDRAMLIGPRPGLSRAMAIFKVEDDRWLLTLVGYAGHPPTDDAAYLEFARTVAPAHVFAAIQAGEALTEVHPFRFPTSRRRRYDRLRRFPAGLLVTGDAICSFNPIYGQGMTVAALQAYALRRTLAGGEQDLARRHFRAVARVVAPVWRLGLNADLAIPEIEAPRPLSFRMVDAYIKRVQLATARDDVVASTFFRVTGLDYPIGRVLRPRRHAPATEITAAPLPADTPPAESPAASSGAA
jgi:2-polyprenyl-6-methoxyphenol hydroxylase-like FAD-dependent oxidoreductase